MAKQDPKFFPEQDVVFMDRGNGCSALLHLHGATLISWKCKHIEHLYLSSTAIFDNKKAIRGGVPLAFPHFGPWSNGPQHGFARIKRWSVVEQPTKESNGDIRAVVALEDDEETRAMWDNKFRVVYTLILSEKSLNSTLTIYNKDTKSFDFTTLLHTYFKVSNINTTSVFGLGGLKYNDKVTGQKDLTEKRTHITVDKNVDSLYRDVPDIVALSNGSEPVWKIEMRNTNFPDIVMWNPWEVKAKEMGDMDDEGFKEFLCVEAGKVAAPVTLEAGAQYQCSQNLRVIG